MEMIRPSRSVLQRCFPWSFVLQFYPVFGSFQPTTHTIRPHEYITYKRICFVQREPMSGAHNSTLDGQASVSPDGVHLRAVVDFKSTPSFNAGTNPRTATRCLERMSLEGAYRIRLADQGLIQPFSETGLRRDSGDGQTGVGLEMGGGARLSLPSAGVQFTGHGKVLVLHGGDIDE